MKELIENLKCNIESLSATIERQEEESDKDIQVLDFLKITLLYVKTLSKDTTKKANGFNWWKSEIDKVLDDKVKQDCRVAWGLEEVVKLNNLI